MVTTRSKSSRGVSSETTVNDTSLLSNRSINSKSKKVKSSKSNDGYSNLIIFISLLLDLFAFTIILPILPRLLNYYQENDSENGLYSTLHKRILQFQKITGIPENVNVVLFGGVLGSMFSFLQFLASPIIGAFSDVYGRKKIILLCLVGLASSYFLWAVSTTFLLFVISRIIAGISKGNLSLSMAAMTDISSPEDRGSGMALIGSAFSIGFVIGPLIGVQFTNQTPFQKQDILWFMPAVIAFGFIVADIIFVLLFFKETLAEQKRMKSIVDSLRQAFSYINPVAIFRFSLVKGVPAKDLRFLRTLGTIYFLYLFIYSGLEFTLTFILYHEFDMEPKQVGLIYCCIGITMALLQGGGVRKIPAQSIRKFALWGLLLTIPSFFCVGVAGKNVYILLAGIFLYSVATSLVVPCMTTLASKHGTASQKGTVLGVFRSLGSFGRALGPLVTSIAYWSLGSPITYCVGGGLLLIPFCLMQFKLEGKT